MLAIPDGMPGRKGRPEGRIVVFLLRNRSQKGTFEYWAYRRAIKGTSPTSNNDLVAMLDQNKGKARNKGSEY
jgi:hypothetical protein